MVNTPPAPAAKPQRRSNPLALKRDAEQAEAKLARLEQDLERVTLELADPALYSGDKGGDRLAALTHREEELRRKIADMEEAWLAAQSQLEQVRSAQA